ncbi:hypothetical protein Flavo103_03050 [Flavobacterium collinsii]|uniref:hypothetical protein n=1 Tax=Flavobacterium collinsii TaxID=1114861 RepID=UPI0022C1F807|nr:hypothetical protein [Flavobacterium collinsii]GIQ57169.1 hypothetical protein Flavo103_03050 [Flavobacterium collinsii]
MQNNENTPIPLGWVGGFPPAGSPMLYPTRDLSSLPMLGNMDNINFLQRQLGVKWPEFSWETQKGSVNPKRCYQQFAPYISRAGYTDEGRVYSVICPQQGVWLKDEICINVEVTVTGQRGWVNEVTKEVAIDMTVEGKIWLTPNEQQGDKIKEIWPLLEYSFPKFPLNKENAIRVTTHEQNNPDQPIFKVIHGLNPEFENPPFALHNDKAFATAYLAVEIGDIKLTKDKVVDGFNQLIMKAFNLGSGNMLQPGNTLSWNLWFTEPALVNREEWKNHANFWRDSIDVHHRSPTGNGTDARYFDGTTFNPEVNAVDEIIKDIIDYVIKHL